MFNQASGYFGSSSIPNQVSPELKENKTKVLLYGILNTITSLALGYFFYLFLESFSLLSIIGLCLFFILSVSLSVFSALAVKEPLERFVIVLLETLALLFFPAKLGGLWTMIGGLSFLIFSISASEVARSHGDNIIKFKFFNAAYSFSKSKSTAFTIFVSLVMFGYGFFNGDKLAKDFVNSSIDSSRFILQRYAPGINSSSPIDDVISSIVEKKAPIGTNISSIEATTFNLKKSLSETVGLKLTGRETIFEIIKNGISAKTKNLPYVFKQIGWIILGILIFWSVKSIAHIFSWPISLVAYMIYKTMLSYGFVRVKEEMITKESIII